MEDKCTILKEYCSVHDFAHGAEAEELRAGIEKIMAKLKRQNFEDEDSISVLRDLGEQVWYDLQKLLDGVDARDSLAFIEAQAQEDER